MKNLLRLEELAQFLLCLLLLITNDVAWWCYLLLLLGPDIGMLGYLINTKVGAVTYNVLHHKALGVLLFVVGSYRFFGAGAETILFDVHFGVDLLMVAGVILYGHASLDRIFGYGLKFGDSFQHTHLGWIGKVGKQEQ
ncbi:MAG: DUF4260 domain-containing protein [Flavobacteriales bacterium]|jgi:hypothetical protein|nr:DUF4260 domain-containing protein [Flavobacteriales bacterium]MBK6551151.1 DUF4260 domain-containing protein [Flavobacteriales bacterium]MBK6883682.1 DUF4260 domain-containing protein [Flavobacteriales bacterium]MBK7101061.1 DUF4260 domain-containing protein [Flavobacteriales bacterium]MBK7111777.1 DUF4260 domain-containing protein [Flavobacteriales bacterium]